MNKWLTTYEILGLSVNKVSSTKNILNQTKRLATYEILGISVDKVSSTKNILNQTKDQLSTY